MSLSGLWKRFQGTRPDAELPTEPVATLQDAMRLHQAGDLDAAKAAYERVLESEPQSPDALHLLGVVHSMQGDHRRAVELIGKAIELAPGNPACFQNRGLAFKHLGEYRAALADYDRLIALSPGQADAYSSRGLALQELGQVDDAIGSFEKAIALRPDFAEAHYNLARALQVQRRFDLAVQSYSRAIALREGFVEALCNRAGTFRELQQLDRALADYEAVIQLRPDHGEALAYRGLTLMNLRRYDAALESCDRALAVAPGLAEAWTIRGAILFELGELAAALEHFDRAIERKPQLAEAHVNRGNALQHLGRAGEALKSFQRAAELSPQSAAAQYGQGLALTALERLDEAVSAFERAFRTDPSYPFAEGAWFHARLDICDWGGIEDAAKRAAAHVLEGRKSVSPFTAIAAFESAMVQRAAAEILVGSKHPSNPILGPVAKRAKGERIRLGYFSADFRNHSVAYLTAGLFEAHDRSRFEVTGFSFGPGEEDEMRARVRAAMDDFVEVSDRSDVEVAAMARERGIDIAIDLGGHTEYARTGIFAARAAPLQVSYLGYLGTMGADYYDYLLADEVIVPEGLRGHYVEKIAYLPSYQANDSRREMATRSFTRAELGLPGAGFVFCCFNNSYKILPATFDRWMRILERVPGSVLLLYVGNATAASNLRREAEARGVEPSRLVFAQRLPRPEYLARFGAADLFLDTCPYNAGTVASDALWAGLPVLTLAGECFASRMGASLLHAIGLPELVAATDAEYEGRAVQIATTPGAVESLKARLEANKSGSPLFDTQRSTHAIESAYEAMYQRYQAGLPPEHVIACR